jgi:hypothetical protein
MAKRADGQPNASETADRIKRQTEYRLALGHFVERFAMAEMVVTLVLWRYAKTTKQISRAVFSGVNLDAAMSTIKRIAEATNAPDKTQNDLEWLFNQLSAIRKARNDILHYGAINVAEGHASVTNALKALNIGRIEYFPISPTILQQMTDDLRKIVIRLHITHLDRIEIHS